MACQRYGLCHGLLGRDLCTDWYSEVHLGKALVRAETTTTLRDVRGFHQVVAKAMRWSWL